MSQDPLSHAQLNKIQAPADEVLDLGAFGLGSSILPIHELIDLVLDQVRVPLAHKLYIQALVQAGGADLDAPVSHADVMRVYVPMVRALGGDIEPFEYNNIDVEARN